MEIREFLLPEAVICMTGNKVQSKNDVLIKIAELAGSVYSINSELAATGLLEREQASSTGLGQGIALPHARSEEYDRIVGIFVKLDTPLEYASPDKKPVDLLFSIFAPNTNSVDYLQSLGNVARMLRTKSIRDRLRSAGNAEEAYAILTSN